LVICARYAAADFTVSVPPSVNLATSALARRAASALYPSAPLKLIENRDMIFRNMQKEMITAEELNSQLRQQGVQNCSEVKEAYIEGDRRISIIRQDNGETGNGNDKKIPL
jgi:uncharacterized membrane protein YcaP (DUF421 family)